MAKTTKTNTAAPKTTIVSAKDLKAAKEVKVTVSEEVKEELPVIKKVEETIKPVVKEEKQPVEVVEKTEEPVSEEKESVVEEQQPVNVKNIFDDYFIVEVTGGRFELRRKIGDRFRTVVRGPKEKCEKVLLMRK